MTPEKSELLHQMLNFDIDGGPSEAPFAQRLARENGWSRAHAERVIVEYKRFLAVAALAGHPVSPSDPVDQVWHLHLLYTESYWNRLCGELLQRPLHHQPSRGGPAEKARFAEWYAKTRESYLSLFGEPPPPDLWPSVPPHKRQQRVDLRQYWLIPKRPLRRALQACAGLATAAMIPIGCEAAELGPEVIGVIVMIAVISVVGLFAVIYSIRHGRGRRGRGGDCGTGGSGCGGGGGGDSNCASDGGGSSCGGGCGGGD